MDNRNYENLSGIGSTLIDENNNGPLIADLGDAILIVGTAAQGPVNQPIYKTTPSDVSDLFGTSGSVYRGYCEAFYGPGGGKNIACVRISNGACASVDIPERIEAGTSGVAQESYDVISERIAAMTVTARYPGDIYNQVSFRTEIVSGYVTVIGYNPITETESTFVYDPSGRRSGSVANTAELAVAINADTNLAAIVIAVVNTIDTSFIINFSGDTTGSLSTDATKTLSLATLLDGLDSDKDGLTDNANDAIVPSGTLVTAGNMLDTLNEVYENVDMETELDVAGKAVATLPYPIQTSGGTAIPFLTLAGTISGDGEAMHKVVNAFLGDGNGTDTEFSMTAYEEVDIATLVVYRTSTSGGVVELTPASSSWADGVLTIELSAAPSTGTVLSVTYDSEAFAMVQATTLTACLASNSYKTYFVSGQRVTFGTAQPADLAIYYSAEKTYDIDVDVNITDAENGEITFGNPLKQPTATSVLYISYTYYPEWVDLSTARSLQYGTDGMTMTNKQKYDLLTDLYDDISDFKTDCVVLMDTYVDDVKVDYDEDTGLPVEINAGFAPQLEVYLEGLQERVNETYGVLAIKPPTSYTLAGIKTWVDKATVISSTDLARAANVMAAADWKLINICAFNAYVSNDAFPSPYVSTGAGLYAGLVSKLPITSAATNKSLGTQVIGFKFKLSSSQANALAGARYVTTEQNSDGSWVITDAPTAALTTSDYTRLSTIKVVFTAIDLVRVIAKPYIGNLFAAPKKLAFQTALDGAFATLQKSGALNYGVAELQQTSAEELDGDGRVLMSLDVPGELRRINIIVKLIKK